MKKKAKTQKTSTVRKSKPDIAEFMVKMEERFTAIESKMNQLLEHLVAAFTRAKESSKEAGHPVAVLTVPPSRPNEAHHHPQQPMKPQPHPHPVPQTNTHPGRTLYKAVCADCSAPCEVPFKPTGDRPIYCKPCFAERKKNRHSGGHGFVPQGPKPGEPRQVKPSLSGVGKIMVSGNVVPLSSNPPKKKHSRDAKKTKHSKRR